MINVCYQQQRILLIDLVEVTQIFLNARSNFVSFFPVIAFEKFQICNKISVSIEVRSHIKFFSFLTFFKLGTSMEICGKNLLRNIFFQELENFIENQKSIRPNAVIVQSWETKKFIFIRKTQIMFRSYQMLILCLRVRLIFYEFPV